MSHKVAQTKNVLDKLGIKIGLVILKSVKIFY
jgi:hypothetical protein